MLLHVRCTFRRLFCDYPSMQPYPTFAKRVLLLALLLIMAACADPDPTPTSQPLPEVTEAPTQAPTVVPTTTALPTATPQPTATPGPLSPVEIYEMVAPSVAFIDTAIATGSGVLIEGDYIVTNAHVVWPYDAARVVFGDGEEHLDVPLVAWDLMTDLAVLGPIDTDAPQQTFQDGEKLPVGSDVYLIGYPGEVDFFPDPSITRGLISRLREWEQADITYFQSDAPIVGGQSGGVMVSEEGDVIGISGFSFTDADFSIVASTADLIWRVEGLIAQEDVDGLGDRRFPTADGVDVTTVTLDNNLDSADFVIYGEVDSTLEVIIDGPGDGAFDVYDQYGELALSADDDVEGVESAEETLLNEPPYFLQIFSFEERRSTFEVNSSQPLIPLDDPDNLHLLQIGDTYAGSIDYPGDFDTLKIELVSGQSINILVDSIMVDPFITLARAGAGSESDITDDDSGGGLFGISAELTFDANLGGTYYLLIESAFGGETGGYYVTLTDADGESTDDTAAQPKPTSTPAAPSDSLATMAEFESAFSAFSIQYPADWSSDPNDEDLALEACDNEDACFANRDGVLSITEVSDIGNVDVEQYADEFIAELADLDDAFRLISRDPIQLDGDLEAEQITYEFVDLFTVYAIVAVSEDGRAFTPSYIFFNDAEAYADMVRTSFETISYER